MLSATISPLEVNAATNIKLDTLVTKDNIYQVLEYLGIDKDLYIENEANQFDNYTVDELQQEICVAKNK